jgi:predicted ATPase
MTSLTKSGPVLLTLEDMHWADGGTVSLLMLLARAVREQQGMIVLTFDNEWIDTHYCEVSPLVDGRGSWAGRGPLTRSPSIPWTAPPW